MILTRSAALRDARAAVHVTALSGGRLAVYTGTMPEAGEAVTGQIMLVEIALPDPAGAVDAGVFTLAPNLEAMAVADGLAAWARLLDGTGAWLMDMDAGATGSGAAIIVSPVQIYAGGTLRIERLRLIEP